MKIFATDSILLTAFLLTQGVALVDITEDRPNHFVFHLTDQKRCNVLKSQYLNNASAPARDLFANREMLLSEIKNRNKEGNKKYGLTE